MRKPNYHTSRVPLDTFAKACGGVSLEAVRRGLAIHGYRWAGGYALLNPATLPLMVFATVMEEHQALLSAEQRASGAGIHRV